MGIFDYFKKKDPLSEFEDQAGKDQGTKPKGEEEKPWEPTKEDIERYKREYEKSQSSVEKPGIFSKAAGAAGKAADWTLKREKELRREREGKKRAEEDQEIKEGGFWASRSVGQGDKIAKEMGIEKEDWFGQKLPPSLLKKIPGVTHTAVTEEFDVKTRAMELGIPLSITTKRRVQEYDNNTGHWIWKDKEETLVKSVAQLRHEIMQYEDATSEAKHVMAMKKGMRKAEPFIIGAQMATGAMHGAADVIKSSAQSPNLRPVGRGSGQVTPMGVRGGSRLFQANFPSSGRGINPTPGAGMSGMRKLTLPGQGGVGPTQPKMSGSLPSIKKFRLF